MKSLLLFLLVLPALARAAGLLCGAPREGALGGDGVHGRVRAALHRGLEGWLPDIEALGQQTRQRWSLDVDPGDLF